MERCAGLNVPLMLILTEGGLTAVSPDRGVDDVVLETSGPAEVDARIRLVIGRSVEDKSRSKIQTSGVTIDEASYSAKVHGRPLDLTAFAPEESGWIVTLFFRGGGDAKCQRQP